MQLVPHYYINVDNAVGVLHNITKEMAMGDQRVMNSVICINSSLFSSLVSLVRISTTTILNLMPGQDTTDPSRVYCEMRLSYGHLQQ